MLELKRLPVGEYECNCYLVIEPKSGRALLIDPGAESDNILDWVGEVQVDAILITHGHHDHVGALAELRQALDVPVGIHPLDQEHFDLHADFDLVPGERIMLGEAAMEVVHLPGHTPGSVGLRVIEDETVKRVIVGDAIFPGGPGHTASPEDLQTALDALADTVFTWGDEVELHPGHGAPTTVGAERAGFEALRAKSLPPDLYGDVTW
jgi:glyoxylase-like metal-dependent hydrolase (beta-lactamase superfamily II)